MEKKKEIIKSKDKMTELKMVSSKHLSKEVIESKTKADKSLTKEKSKVKIGIEVHGYLITNQKLFCECSTDYKTAKVNTNICPICTAQPGCKPMLPNEEALRKVIAISLMLGCKISSEKVIWQRKHYEWPDLPKGYQDTISGAYSVPVGAAGEFLGIRIRGCHLEEDPARWDPSNGNVDYNRCGVPLIEIVTEPDFTNNKQVIKWLKQLVLTLSYIKALDQDAGIKADINVSVGGERVEVKNVNSLYSIERAISYEILRQEEIFKRGEKVKRETRAYSEESKSTIAMRTKEQTEDYRYIPDPDLPIIAIDKKMIDELKKSLPEPPGAKVKRFITQYKIGEYESSVLAGNKDIADFFEKIIAKIPPQLAARWVTVELLRVLNWNKKEFRDVDIKSEHFIELLDLINNNKITEEVAKKALNQFVPKSFSLKQKLKGSEKITDKKEIEAICKKVMQQNQKAVEDYKAGEKKALHFLIGKVMQETKGRADNSIVQEIILKLI